MHVSFHRTYMHTLPNIRKYGVYERDYADKLCFFFFWPLSELNANVWAITPSKTSRKALTYDTYSYYSSQVLLKQTYIDTLIREMSSVLRATYMQAGAKSDIYIYNTYRQQLTSLPVDENTMIG